jgi:thiamine-monophosphate kinase
VDLVGGDTTRGPLNLSVTIMGEVPQGKALRRSGAHVGDDIWVSGTLGEAALGLAHLQGRIALPDDARAFCLSALHQPQPRIALGLALRGFAHSAIDISDGLLADLGHILDCSKIAAELRYDRLPKPSLSSVGGDGLAELAQRCVLSGGDDYELCFTAPVSRRAEIETLATRLNQPLSRVGSIVSGRGCKVRAEDGSVMKLKDSGYDHFA